MLRAIAGVGVLPRPPESFVARPWNAENQVDLARARALVRTGMPALDAREVESLGAGWDNSAFLVDGTWVVRFPRRTSAVGLLETEIRVLPALADRLPLAVPDPVFVARGLAEHPWPFAAYRSIPGRTACRAELGIPARRGAAPALGRFLRALHDIDPDGLDLPLDTLGRLRLEPRRAELGERLAVLADRRAIEDPARWLDAFDAAGPDLDDAAAGCVVHGDLYARHLVVDEVGRLVGVIDWGDVHRGHPAADLMAVFTFLPVAARPAFFAEYGAVDTPVRRAARRRAVFHATAVAWYAVEEADEVLAAEALGAMRRAVE